MPDFNTVVGVVALVNVALILLFAYIVYSVVHSLKGINKAAWAIVSQLQHIRSQQATPQSSESPVIDHEATRRAHEIAHSAFGR